MAPGDHGQLAQRDRHQGFRGPVPDGPSPARGGGRYRRVNHQLEGMLGVGSGEVTGKTDAGLFPATNARLHHETDSEAVERREPITYEESADLRGTRRIFQTSKFALNDADGQPFAICAIWS